jgi:hypothetical protein
VFGLDVLVDNNLHPWILEINANPSFNVYSNDVPAQEPSPDIGQQFFRDKNVSEIDLYLKSLVITDAIRLVSSN